MKIVIIIFNIIINIIIIENSNEIFFLYTWMILLIKLNSVQLGSIAF
jgi:hypothetical protein